MRVRIAGDQRAALDGNDGSRHRVHANGRISRGGEIRRDHFVTEGGFQPTGHAPDQPRFRFVSPQIAPADKRGIAVPRLADRSLVAEVVVAALVVVAAIVGVEGDALPGRSVEPGAEIGQLSRSTGVAQEVIASAHVLLELAGVFLLQPRFGEQNGEGHLRVTQRELFLDVRRVQVRGDLGG